MDGVKDKIMSLFKTNITNDYNKPTHDNKVYEVERNQENQKKNLKIERQHN